MNLEEWILQRRSGTGEPFCAYIYDLRQLQQHVAAVKASLPPSCRLFYAIKANSESMILRTLQPLVDGFEVASLGEIDKVRKLDGDMPLIFGGPGKTDRELAGAIRQGVQLIHVESAHELRRLAAISEREGVTVPVLLRVNLRDAVASAQLQMAGAPTQFGMDEEEIPAVLAECQGLSGVSLRGFHFHAMSNNLDADTHLQFVRHCLNTAKRWVCDLGLSISHLNLGGGIGVNYRDIGRQFDWERFAAGMADIDREQNEQGWTLILECGRYLTAFSGYYAVEVLDIKRNHGKHFAVVRGGSHHFRLPAAWKQSHPFTIIPVDAWPYPFARPEISDSPVTIAGQLCTPNDVLARDVVVPRLRAGDILLFSHAGAYGWAISHHDFLSHPHPEQIFLGEETIT